MKILIVDDEGLARTRLRLLLAEHDDVEMVDEAGSVDEALGLHETTAADVVVLDVEMPRRRGFQLIDATGGSPAPVVIFTTAHSEFAVDAFDIGATDYLLKPFGRERVNLAMGRARRALANPSVEIRRSPKRPAGTPRDRFAVRSRGEILFVRATDIVWIGAEGNYVRLHTPRGTHLLRDQLKSLEDQLDPGSFVRVHRSAIVNLDRIVKLVTDADGSHSILLEGGSAVSLGPNYRKRFEESTGAKF